MFPLNVIMLRHVPPRIDCSSNSIPGVKIIFVFIAPVEDVYAKVPFAFFNIDTLGFDDVAIFLTRMGQPSTKICFTSGKHFWFGNQTK